MRTAWRNTAELRVRFWTQVRRPVDFLVGHEAGVLGGAAGGRRGGHQGLVEVAPDVAHPPDDVAQVHQNFASAPAWVTFQGVVGFEGADAGFAGAPTRR